LPPPAFSLPDVIIKEGLYQVNEPDLLNSSMEFSLPLAMEFILPLRVIGFETDHRLSDRG
jgi:hypothetical protein